MNDENGGADKRISQESGDSGDRSLGASSVDAAGVSATDHQRSVAPDGQDDGRGVEFQYEASVAYYRSITSSYFPPEWIKGYEETYPGSADRMLTIYEETMRTQNADLTKARDIQKNDHETDNWNMKFMTVSYSVMVFIAFIAGLVLAFTGRNGMASISFGVSVMTLLPRIIDSIRGRSGSSSKTNPPSADDPEENN